MLRSDLELLNLEPPQGMAGAERWNPIWNDWNGLRYLNSAAQII
jgi:hypothetical protein